MQKNRRSAGLIPFFSLFLLLFALGSVRTPAQAATNLQAPSPDAQAFVSTDELAVPWRETGCGAERKGLDSGCHVVASDEYVATSRLSLFNPDGSLWFRFSIFNKDSDHFVVTPNGAFRPFAIIGFNEIMSAGPILRLIGVSKDWYKVEVNEVSRETKFISRKDQSWARVSWDYWWTSNPQTYINPSVTVVHDAPNGKPIESHGVTNLLFKKTDGDWAKILWFHSNIPFEGWIRWRDGRKVLVGCLFNSFEVPDDTR